jgi:hypothetical protein
MLGNIGSGIMGTGGTLALLSVFDIQTSVASGVALMVFGGIIIAIHALREGLMS